MINNYKKLIFFMVLAIPFLSLRADMSSEEGIKGLVYVVVKQAEIKGQVFVIVGDEEGTSRPASDLPVEVKDTNKAGVILSVKTDEKGIFYLPNMDKGEYILTVSKLDVRLKIVEEAENSNGKHSYASKIIIIFLPPEMVIKE